MNEYLRAFQSIIQSVEPLVRDDYNSLEIQQSAASLKHSVEPCFKELKQSATKLNGLVQVCFNDLYHAEDVWNSKQRITGVPTHEIWEQVGDLSGSTFRIRLLGSQCKTEAVKQVKDSWSKRFLRVRLKCFECGKNTVKSGLSIFEKDNFFKELSIELQLQIKEVKLTLIEGTKLIFFKEVEGQIASILKYNSQLDKKQETELTTQIASITESIVTLVERAFNERIYTIPVNVKGLIDSVSDAAETLAKQGVLGVSWDQFVKCYEEVATKLETIVATVFNALIKLATQVLEQVLLFYNNFLERQVRYRQETPEQRQSEKAWIEQQRSVLARVENGIEVILNE